MKRLRRLAEACYQAECERLGKKAHWSMEEETLKYWEEVIALGQKAYIQRSLEKDDDEKLARILKEATKLANSIKKKLKKEETGVVKPISSTKITGKVRRTRPTFF